MEKSQYERWRDVIEHMPLRLRQKSKTPKPRPMTCWAIMDVTTRKLTSVYERQYGKRYVLGDCEDGQTAVRVHVIPYAR